MGEVITKLRKANYWLKHRFLVFDNLVLLAAIVCCLIWTWGSISSMSRNWGLAQELMNKQREKALLELEVETMELENQYYLTEEYQELAARKYQNKKLPGETMVYLPANSEVAKNKYKTVVAVANDEEGPVMTNFQQWMAFLFGV